VKRAILLAMLIQGVAGAHYIPSDRLVVVQAEPHAVAMLVTFHPDTGALGRVLNVPAVGLAPNGSTTFLRWIYAARAIAPLHAFLDGKPLAWAHLDAKIVEDPPGTGRASVAVLLDAPVGEGPHRLELRVDPSPEPTESEWVDRADGAVIGPPAQQIVNGATAILLDWK
jgi:hypothetical protein